MAKKKRRKPRKRFDTLDQVRKKVERDEKLLVTWITKASTALTKVQGYQQRLAYYRKRQREMEDTLITQAETEIGRPLRSVQLDVPSSSSRPR